MSGIVDFYVVLPLSPSHDLTHIIWTHLPLISNQILLFQSLDWGKKIIRHTVKGVWRSAVCIYMHVRTVRAHVHVCCSDVCIIQFLAVQWHSTCMLRQGPGVMCTYTYIG